MSDDMRQQVEEYHELVKRYHRLDEEIDSLLTAHHGHTENMSEEAMAQYRKLARERDDVFNAMRHMEQTLFVDDEADI